MQTLHSGTQNKWDENEHTQRRHRRVNIRYIQQQREQGQGFVARKRNIWDESEYELAHAAFDAQTRHLQQSCNFRNTNESEQKVGALGTQPCVRLVYSLRAADC